MSWHQPGLKAYLPGAIARLVPRGYVFSSFSRTLFSGRSFCGHSEQCSGCN